MRDYLSGLADSCRLCDDLLLQGGRGQVAVAVLVGLCRFLALSRIPKVVFVCGPLSYCAAVLNWTQQIDGGRLSLSCLQ